jgi:FkbM family methyltransferase
LATRCDPVDPGEDGDKEPVERLIEAAARLPLKARMRMLDALRAGAVVRHDDGVSFGVESLAEFKRARKRSGANRDVEAWVGSFHSGDVLYDVGANTGALALRTASAHGGRVRVFAFEPASDTYAALVRNIELNGASAVVTPLHVGLLDVTALQPLHRASTGAGTALHAVGEALDYRRQPFTPVAVESILAFRLDDLVPLLGLPAPTRLKIDVDGFENKVLDGAARVLATARCDVYLELVETVAGDPHVAQVMARLRGLGYELAQLVEHRAAGVYPRIVDALFVHGARAGARGDR